MKKAILGFLMLAAASLAHAGLSHGGSVTNAPAWRDSNGLGVQGVVLYDLSGTPVTPSAGSGGGASSGISLSTGTANIGTVSVNSDNGKPIPVSVVAEPALATYGSGLQAVRVQEVDVNGNSNTATAPMYVSGTVNLIVPSTGLAVNISNTVVPTSDSVTANVLKGATSTAAPFFVNASSTSGALALESGNLLTALNVLKGATGTSAPFYVYDTGTAFTAASTTALSNFHNGARVNDLIYGLDTAQLPRTLFMSTAGVLKIIPSNGANDVQVSTAGDSDSSANQLLYTEARESLWNGASWSRHYTAGGLSGTANFNAAITSESARPGYAAACHGIVTAASCTDFFTIKGSATKTIIIKKIVASGIATAAGTDAVYLVYRGTSSTAGTSTSATAATMDQTDPVATASLLAYTANPITVTGNILWNGLLPLAVTAGGAAVTGPSTIWDASSGMKPIFLRGIAQQLSLSLNGTTGATGSAIDVAIYWEEQ